MGHDQEKAPLRLRAVLRRAGVSVLSLCSTVVADGPPDLQETTFVYKRTDGDSLRVHVVRAPGDSLRGDTWPFCLPHGSHHLPGRSCLFMG